MKELKYINDIFSNQDEVEAGLLKDLTVEPPHNMHEDVMRNIKSKENRLMRRFNFKKYLSVAAAIVIFIAGAGRIAYVGLEKESEVNIVAQKDVNKELNTNENANNLVVALENTKTNQNNLMQKNTAQTKKETSKTTKNTQKQNVEKPKQTNENKTTDVNTTKVAVAQQNNISSTGEHNDNVLNTLSQANVTYEYELYYMEGETNLFEYLNNNATKISDELYSFTTDKFEEFKKYVNDNKFELKSINLAQQNTQSNEIVIRLIKK